MRKHLLIWLIVVFTNFVLPSEAATIKVGGSCTKLGQIKIVNNYKFTCVKSGKKIVWGPGVLIKKVAPTPSPTSSSLPSTKPSESTNSQTKSPNYFTGDPDNPPKFIVANIVDPSKIYLISRFRSGIGHDFSVNSGETCRSMKHYLSAYDPEAPDYKIESNGAKSAMPAPVQGIDVPIYSPVDGVINIESGDGTPFNQSVDIVPNNYKMFTIKLGHVFPIEGLKVGQSVKAGQQVGLILRNQTFDFDIETMVDDSQYMSRYISGFMAMSDEVFAQWQKRGVLTRENLVLSKVIVDANPWKCVSDASQKSGGGLFAVDYMANASDFMRNLITLPGYQEVTDAINKKYGR